MSKSDKKNKRKNSTLKKIKKTAKKYTGSIAANNILLGITGGAIISGLIFAGIRSGLVKKIKENKKD